MRIGTGRTKAIGEGTSAPRSHPHGSMPIEPGSVAKSPPQTIRYRSDSLTSRPASADAARTTRPSERHDDLGRPTQE